MKSSTARMIRDATRDAQGDDVRTGTEDNAGNDGNDDD